MIIITQKILEIIEAELVGLGFKQNDRNTLSVALFDISLDHANAIITLIEKKKPIIPSAYALVRPMFESFIRAAWLQHCATEKQIKEIIKRDSFPLKLREMLEAVEKENKWPETLTNIMKRAIKNMHSYTHGGMQLINRRYKSGVLAHVMDKDEINDVATFIVLVAYVSFCQIVAIANTKEKDTFIKSLYHDITTQFMSSE